MIKKVMKKIIIKIKPLYRALSYIKRRVRRLEETSQLMTKSEILFLLEIAGENKDIIEIGVSTGQTTRRLSKKNQVIAIDPFIPGKEGLLMSRYLKDFHHEFLTNIKGRFVVFYNMTSEKAFNLWDKKIKLMVDGIFIDGEHSYAAVKHDSKWIKYVKKGGFIAFHDVLGEIKDFVEAFIVPNYELIGKRDNLWIFKKSN
ncbi:MAG: class I SAM-dependent methyltransferase [Candidatus Nealsonbacteria bacterium]